MPYGERFPCTTTIIIVIITTIRSCIFAGVHGWHSIGQLAIPTTHTAASAVVVHDLHLYQLPETNCPKQHHLGSGSAAALLHHAVAHCSGSLSTLAEARKRLNGKSRCARGVDAFSATHAYTTEASQSRYCILISPCPQFGHWYSRTRKSKMIPQPALEEN